MKQKNKDVIQWLCLLLLLYVGVVCIIMRFANPSYTETELFLSIPRAIMLDFK